MKKKHNETDKLLDYCDASSSEEMRLRLLSNLLVSSTDGLDAQDTRQLGVALRAMLERKLLLDHYFWKRKISESLIPKEDFEIRFTLLEAEMKITKGISND